jgi:hypothetical protein
MTQTIITPAAAVEKANQQPRPLSKKGRAIVAERDAAVAAALPGLAAKFGKRHVKATPVETSNRKGHGQNGYNR